MRQVLSTPSAQSVLDNLVARFPQVGEAKVCEILTKNDGHAGLAAKDLRLLTSSSTTSAGSPARAVKELRMLANSSTANAGLPAPAGLNRSGRFACPYPIPNSSSEMYSHRPLGNGIGIEDDWSDDEASPLRDDGPQPCLSIAPCQDVGPDGGEHMVTLSISVPESRSEGMSDVACLTSARVPSDVCCLIDISGSMAKEASYEDENENVKSDGLTYLDIVKHAVKTVMHMLNEQDRLALVAFDNNADLVFAPGFMTSEGRESAMKALDALRPRGRTDIWKGLHAGLESLRTSEHVGFRPKTVLLLTDGLPSISRVPPRGHVAELRDYKECHPEYSFVINTFGFGYKLDSELLLDLAEEGCGTYDFIPDALIVGTCFVDSIANVLSTHTQMATVHLKTMSDAQFAGPVLGVNGQMVTDTCWGRVVNLGPIQFGGTREVVLPLRFPPGDEPYLEAVLVYPGADGKEKQVFAQGSSRKAAELATVALARSDAVSVAYESVRLGKLECLESAQKAMLALVDRLAGLELVLQSATDKSWSALVTRLKADIGARGSKALLGKERFDRWGKHYLRAFVRAHQVQYCTNFMDKSLQDYGGNLFRALREEGDAIFVSLPPPIPVPAPKPAAPLASAAPHASAKPRASAPPPFARVNSRPAPAPKMNVYYGGGGGG